MGSLSRVSLTMLAFVLTLPGAITTGEEGVFVDEGAWSVRAAAPCADPINAPILTWLEGPLLGGEEFRDQGSTTPQLPLENLGDDLLVSQPFPESDREGAVHWAVVQRQRQRLLTWTDGRSFAAMTTVDGEAVVEEPPILTEAGTIIQLVRHDEAPVWIAELPEQRLGAGYALEWRGAVRAVEYSDPPDDRLEPVLQVWTPRSQMWADEPVILAGCLRRTNGIVSVSMDLREAPIHLTITDCELPVVGTIRLDQDGCWQTGITLPKEITSGTIRSVTVAGYEASLSIAIEEPPQRRFEGKQSDRALAAQLEAIARAEIIPDLSALVRSDFAKPLVIIGGDGRGGFQIHPPEARDAGSTVAPVGSWTWALISEATGSWPFVTTGTSRPDPSRALTVSLSDRSLGGADRCLTARVTNVLGQPQPYARILVMINEPSGNISRNWTDPHHIFHANAKAPSGRVSRTEPWTILRTGAAAPREDGTWELIEEPTEGGSFGRACGGCFGRRGCIRRALRPVAQDPLVRFTGWMHTGLDGTVRIPWTWPAPVPTSLSLSVVAFTDDGATLTTATISLDLEPGD